jgi:murein DD-endopeptidase MepM/ murein hydrolase activator NlpD
MATTYYYTSLFKKSDVRITTKFSSTHKGLDLSRGIVETPIYFPNKAVSGEVWKILKGYTLNGKYYADAPIIYIKHKDGSGSRYIHSYPKNVKVKVGDKVKVGQQICCTGNSGYSFGDHLHFEWLKKWDDLNTRVDPTPFVIDDKVVTPPVVPPVTPPVEPPVTPGLTECQKMINDLNQTINELRESLADCEAQRKLVEAVANENMQVYLELQKKYDILHVDFNRIENEKNEAIAKINMGLAGVSAKDMFAELWRRLTKSLDREA